MGFRGRAQGPAPTITVGGRPLCLSGGTTGDVVTSAVDDYNVDSRFHGNDEMRDVGCGFHECGCILMWIPLRSPIGVGDKFSGNDDPKKHPHIRGNALA